MSAKQLGIDQYSTFVDDRIFNNDNAAIPDTILFLYSMAKVKSLQSIYFKKIVILFLDNT